MESVLRKVTFAVPFGCLAAIAAHAVRFGEDHAFGGEANDALVATAVAGTLAVAVAILHAFLTAGTTTPTATLAAARARQLVPGSAMLFALAATIYYGIEALEGHGLEVGLPTMLLGAFAAVLALTLRGAVAILAGVVADMVSDFVALLTRQEHIGWHQSLQAQVIYSQVPHAARRFGRAPPNERRLS
jgi:hypothetical protein